MKRLEIEWRHLDKEGNTCIRCSDTGKTLEEVIAELKKECSRHDVQIVFRETKLSEQDIRESNKVLFNGIPIEALLPGAMASENSCESCCDFTGRETYCRTVEYEGQTYEAIPGHLIREAACRVVDCC